MNKKSAGFTMIELVIVIVILGILAATALPRFVDLSGEADVAAVAGVGGGFTAATQLARATWLARGNTGAGDINMGGATVGMNANGWPVGGTGATSLAAGAHAQCVAIWQNIMQNAPTVEATGGAGTADWIANAAAADQCQFSYRRDNDMSITYSSADGTVTVDSDPS